MAYGGPNKIEDIKPFYTDIRRGKEPTPEQLEELTERYRHIGGKSPLLEITTLQGNALQEALGEEYKVYIGMRHWEPWIRDAVKEMKEDGVEDAVAMVMAPHFSKLSVEKYMEGLEKAMAEENYSPNIRKIQSWNMHPLYLRGLEERIGEALNNFTPLERKELLMLFTAHSLPEKIKEWNDPYETQLIETSGALAESLKQERWSFAYQSAGRTPEPWLGPDILDAIEEAGAKGIKNILVCSIGFIADHLEVIYDIDIEARPAAEKLGIHLERARSLNDSFHLIEAFRQMVEYSFSK